MTTPAPAALHPARIHPSAIVEDSARLGMNVEIGPFCHVGPKVTLGDNVQLLSHVVIQGCTTIGDGSVVFPNAVLGCAPQNIHYKGEDTELIIGHSCTIREGVTMHPGMPDFGGKTTVGNNSMFLAYSHVAHDCHVGDNVILSNNVMLAGHVTIGDRVIMGGGAAVHQFVRIGHHAFIGGLAAVNNDVIPYGMLNGNPGILMGLNIIGMQRSGFDKTAIHAVRRAFKAIFNPATPIRENIARVREQPDNNAAVADIIAFIDAESERALSSPARGQRLKPVSAAPGAPDIKGRLSILAGKGRFPVLVAEAARRLGHDPYIFRIRNEADQDWSGFDNCQISIADLSRFAATVRREGIGSVVLAGGIGRRPDLADLRPTWRSLIGFASSFRVFATAGDDKLLRFAINVLENEGVRVLAAQQVAPDLLGRAGPVGRLRPGKADLKDIAAASEAALALGRLDIGQGAVSVHGRVIAIEGLEGTDAMLARVADLRAGNRLSASGGGVLVKLCKQGQDERADLPSIGLDTVINAHAAGLSGIAIEAGRALVLERDRVVSEADRLGLFVTGIEPREDEVDQCLR